MRRIGTRAFLIVLLTALSTSTFGSDGHIVLGGADDGGAMIYYPRQVEEGPDGNLYVLDSGDSYIKVFSPAGEFLRQIGGAGGGPGEFQRIDGASFGFTEDNNLFFTEYIGGHHWISVLKLDGDLVRVVSPQIGVIFGVEAASSIEGGGFFALLTYNSRPRRQRDFYYYDTPQSLVRIDSTGLIVSEIVRAEHTKLISYLPDGATTNLPFTPVFAWAAVGDNQVVWGDGMSSRFRVFDSSGEVVRDIETPLPDPLPVTKLDLEEWRANREEIMVSRNPAWWHEFGRVVEEYKEPLYDKPILRRLSPTPEGNWLVEGSAYSQTGESTYWLLDERGTLLGAVSASAWGAHLSNSFLLFFASGEDELPLVHAVERFTSDLESLELLGGY